MTLTRRLASGTTQLTISNGLLRLLTIVTMPILTRLLSPKTYGIAALVSTVISLVSVFAIAGVDMSYARAYHSVRPPSGPAVEHFCWRFSILAAAVMALLAAVAFWFIHRDSVDLDRRLAIPVAIGIVGLVLQTMAQTRARLAGRYRALALTIVASGLVAMTLSVSIAVWWRADVFALLLPMLLGYFMQALLLGAPSLTALARPSSLARGEGISLVKIGVAGIVTAPMLWMLSSSDRWFLQRYHGAESVGVYSAGYGVAVLGMMLNSSLMSVWLPEAAREYERDPAQAQDTLGRLMSRLIAAMALVWLAVSAAGGDALHWLVNERFHSAAVVVPYIAGAVFFYGVQHLANTGLLLAKQLRWSALWWFVGGLASALLNLASVPRFGLMGAALTQLVSFAFISTAVFVTAQVYYRMRLDWTRLALTSIVVIAAGVAMARAWHASPALSLMAKLPVGISVAVLIAWLNAPDWCAKGIDRVRRSGPTHAARGT